MNVFYGLEHCKKATGIFSYQGPFYIFYSIKGVGLDYNSTDFFISLN